MPSSVPELGKKEARSLVHPSVSQVEAGGLWEQEDGRGRYRVVVTNHCSPEHCFERPRLQWLREDPTGDRLVADARIGVDELTVVSKIDFWPSGEWRGVIQLELENSYDGAKSHACVRPKGLGRLEVKAGKCR